MNSIKPTGKAAAVHLLFSNQHHNNVMIGRGVSEDLEVMTVEYFLWNGQFGLLDDAISDITVSQMSSFWTSAEAAGEWSAFGWRKSSPSIRMILMAVKPLHNNLTPCFKQ